MIRGLMALWWSGKSHDTPSMADQKRDYSAIGVASRIAREGVVRNDVNLLGQGIAASYAVQLAEGMDPLPEAQGCLGRKYCGGGIGGYALYLFGSEKERTHFVTRTSGARVIEPYSSWE